LRLGDDYMNERKIQMGNNSDDKKRELFDYFKLIESDDNCNIDPINEKAVSYIISQLKDDIVNLELEIYHKDVNEALPNRLKAYSKLFDSQRVKEVKHDLDVGFVLTDDNGNKIEIEVEEQNNRVPERIIKYALAGYKGKIDNLVKAYSNIDPNEKTVEINGNRFSYDKHVIDISKYEEELFDVGNRKKGCSWNVELDDNGEIVLIC